MNRELCGDCIHLYTSIVAPRFDYCTMKHRNLNHIGVCSQKITKRPKIKIKDGFYE